MKKFLLFIIIISSAYVSRAGDEVNDFEDMLMGWSESFLLKVPDSYTDTLNFLLKDDESYWHVVFEDDTYSIHRSKNPGAKFIFTASMDTFSKIFSGQLSPMTAIGRSSIYEAAPLDFILGEGMTIGMIDWNYAYFTIINFFNPHPNNKVLLGREHSRTVHGGNVVGLYYSVGYRSAWYNLAKGQVLNEEGEKDPWQQSFIITQGSGYAKIGNDTLRIKADEAYYIRPNVEHKVWTDSEEGVSLLWNAWGNEAW